MTIAAFLATVDGKGARVSGIGDRCTGHSGRPPGAPAAALSRRKVEWPEDPPPVMPEIATLLGHPPDKPWIDSGRGHAICGYPREAGCHPPVSRAGSLVGIRDDRSRAGRTNADRVAEEIHQLLAAVRLEKIDPWLTT